MAGNAPPKWVQAFPHFGIEYFPASVEEMESFGADDPDLCGVYISKVWQRSFMYGELKSDDVLVGFNGYKLNCHGEALVKDVQEALNINDLGDRLIIGSKIKVEIFRKGKLEKFEVAFSPTPFPPIRKIHAPVREHVAYEAFNGMVFMDLTMNHVEKFAPKNLDLVKYTMNEDLLLSPRVIVSSVLSLDGTADGAIKPGDIVSQLNGKHIATLGDLVHNFEPEPKSNFWSLKLQHGGLVVLNFKKAMLEESEISEEEGYVLGAGYLKTVKGLSLRKKKGTLKDTSSKKKKDKISKEGGSDSPSKEDKNSKEGGSDSPSKQDQKNSNKGEAEENKKGEDGKTKESTEEE